MARTTQTAGGGITISRIIPTLVSLGLLFLFWQLGLKWAAIPLFVALAAYHLLLPRLVRSRLEHFHTQSLRLLTSGRALEIPALVRKNILLQLAGPKAAIDAKLALAYSASGAFAQSIPFFASALEDSRPEERPALEAGYVKALFATGDVVRAEQVARTTFSRGTQLPETMALCARARIALNRCDDETRSLIDDAERASSSRDVALMALLSRIELALATGRRPPELPDDITVDQRFLKAWLSAVRGLLAARDGKEPSARKHFERALTLAGENGFASGIAREGLERLGAKESSGSIAAETLDPALRRKKRKRR